MNVDNRQDVLDSRDIIERLQELRDERDNLQAMIDEADEGDELPKDELQAWLDDNGDELKALESLESDCEGYSDWQYGETLIRRSYWVDYVRELLEDCGDIPKNIPWYVSIDWEATAKNIEADYAEVDFDGVEYLIRNC